MSIQELILNMHEELLSEIRQLREEISSSYHINSYGKDYDLGDGVIMFSIYKKGVLISGDTRTYKDELKEYNAKWNPKLKGWITSQEKAREIIPRMISIHGDKIFIGSDELNF